MLPSLWNAPHTSSTPNPTFADLILVVLLGTNMLIARMSKTFDSIYVRPPAPARNPRDLTHPSPLSPRQEQMNINYMYLTALIVVSWSQAPVVPPPFAVLGLPYLLSARGFSFLYRICCSKCSWASAEAATYKTHEDEAETLPAEDVPTLKAKMEAYLEERAGEQGEDDKWRTQVAKQQAQMAKQLAQGEKSIGRVEEQLAQMAKQLELLLQKMNGA